MTNSRTLPSDEDIELLVDKYRITECTAVANEMNNFFSNVGKTITKDHIQVSSPSHPIYTFDIQTQNSLTEFEHTNISEIKFIISSLEICAAPGFDDIQIEFLKQNSRLFSQFFTTSINNSFDSQTFPDSLKIAKIKPIFKSGSKLEISNYRPISVLPAMSKIYEIIIRDRLENFVLENKILHPNQFGFIRKSSTTSACASLINKIVLSLDKSKKTACVFIDLKKAFDSLAFNQLLQILQSYHINGNALKILQSYLSNRKQFVNIKGKYSAMLNVDCGVPQGSVLGPLLFNLYINDLLRLKLNGSAQLYADDCALIYSEDSYLSLAQAIHDDLETLFSWLLNRNLVMNLTKTKLMIFNLKESLPNNHQIFNIKINGAIIERVRDYEYLGLTIDDSLNWKLHIEKVGKKVAPFIGLCLRLRPFVNQSTLMSIYYAWVESRLNYCLPIWSSAPKSYLVSLQTLQNRCLKIIQFKPRLTSSIHIYSVNLLSFNQKIVYEKIFTIYKMINGILKCNELLVPNLAITGYATRSKLNIRLPPYLKKLSQLSLFYEGLNLYNKLPNKLRGNKSIGIFKRELKLYVFESIELKLN